MNELDVVNRLWPLLAATVYFLDLTLASLGAWRLWQIRDKGSFRITNYLGILLTAKAFDAACTLIASLDRPSGVHYSWWFTIWFWTGRLVRSAATWAIVWYIIGIGREHGRSTTSEIQ